MRKQVLILTMATLACTSPMVSFAAMDHGNHAGHGAHTMDKPAHEEVVEGVKATFTVRTMADAMKEMGMQMPKGVKETHHVSVVFKDVKTGKALTEGMVKIKIQNPDKSEQTRDLTGMQGHFGADVEMAKKGNYGVMCKFKLKDGKVRQARFWYVLK